MRYVAWAALYEGSSDALYLDILLPRIIRDLVAREGIDLVEVPDASVVKFRAGRGIDDFATEACASRAAYDIMFIHADTGGRALERGLPERADAYCAAMAARCEWLTERCITITPRHETEAWLLADDEAITSALGYHGAPGDLGLPMDARAAERLADPKAVLAGAIAAVAGRRRSERVDTLFPAVAQRQRVERLRRSASFLAFENRLRVALRGMQCIR